MKFVFLQDPNTRVNAWQNGEVDGGWAVPSNAYAQLTSGGQGSLYYGLNTTVVSQIVSNLDGPLGDPKVRQALLMATDRAGMVKAGEAGVAEVAESLVTRGTWGGVSAAQLDEIYGALPKYPYDVDAAKAMVADSGIAGKKIVIATSPVSVAADVVTQATAQAAKAIGLVPEIKTISPDQYTTLFSDPAARKGIDLFYTAWYTSLADPIEMYGVLRTGEFSNYGNWSDPAFDGDIEAAVAAPVTDPHADGDHRRRPADRDGAAALAAVLHPADQPLAGQQDHRGGPVDLLHVLPVGRHHRSQGLMPGAGEELHYLTASEAIQRFRNRELSPVELLDAVLARVAVVEPAINALTEQLVEEAYAAARESEARYARADGSARPLEGVPLLVKEEQPIAGRTIEEGSLLEKGVVSEVTHPVVTRVLEAGAVVHGRTTTPEFSCAPFTHSTLWGVTRNPWDLALSPGGSSGGSGAALAAGETLLATGSDIGGSIRIPASLCGLVGFKPPFGRVPGMPPFNSDTYCADGPLGRTVADVARLQNVLAGPHPGDQASLRPAYVLPESSRTCAGCGWRCASPSVTTWSTPRSRPTRDGRLRPWSRRGPWSRRSPCRGRREELTAAAWAHFGAIFGASVSELAGDQVGPAHALHPGVRPSGCGGRR